MNPTPLAEVVTTFKMKHPIAIAALSLLLHSCSANVATPPPVASQPLQQNKPVAQAKTASEPKDISSKSVEPEITPPIQQVSETQQSVSEERGREVFGKASTGETVILHLESIQIAPRSLGFPKPSYFFKYAIGNETVEAFTACNGRFYTPDQNGEFTKSVQPNSVATQGMLDRVCSHLVRTVRVVSPPSHVRFQPNGSIACTIQNSQTITTFGQHRDYAGWLYTDACGKLALIHTSQIQD